MRVGRTHRCRRHTRGGLWVNGSSSNYGRNDRVPQDRLDAIEHSLVLIRPDELRIQVATEGGGRYESRRRVRARFRLGDQQYTLSVTDPPVERRFLAGDDGTFRVEEAIMCVSLGEIFHDYAYKLVAAILTPSRVEQLRP